MQIVSEGNNLHEMFKPVFWGKNKKNTFVSSENRLWYFMKIFSGKKKNIINMYSADSAKRMVKINTLLYT